MSAQFFITECELCHKQQKNPPLHIGTIDDPGKEIESYLAKIYMHLGTSHRKEFQVGKELIGCFQQFLALSQVKTEDPAIQRYYDELRENILRLFVTVADEAKAQAPR